MHSVDCLIVNYCSSSFLLCYYDCRLVLAMSSCMLLAMLCCIVVSLSRIILQLQSQAITRFTFLTKLTLLFVDQAVVSATKAIIAVFS